MINATNETIKIIADCHIKAFPESIAVKLGHSFVCKMLEWYLSGPNKFLFWIENDGKCVGYCGGHIIDGSDAYGASSGMTQFGFGAAMKAIMMKPWLLFHPEIRSRYPFIITNVKRKFSALFLNKSSQPAINNIATPIQKPSVVTAGLVVIGVLPEKQGTGIGSLLQKEFENRASTMGAQLMQLSVRKSNAQAIRSYERNGWKIVNEQGISYLMQKQLY